MSEISLRDYHKQLDNLLQNDQTDELIEHCRHILKQYPKNATTYRFLGRALLRQSRWEEAGEIFRRLLSTYPNDLIAHRSLSEIYHKLGQPAAALWHLERAFDHRPNDKGILAKMREYYQAYHGVALERVQLTAGAAARQYIQSGLYSRAVDTLRGALQHAPERLDLKLLLAQALWLHGRRLEAAETAIEVLERLPFAVEANQLLTELWLNERRPSDAQRYLSRIEVVEPYLAYELATGKAVDDHVIALEELDYKRVVAAKTVQSQPDWLSNIDSDLSDDVADDTNWMEEIEPLETAPPAKKITDDLSDLLPDDWEGARDAQDAGRTVQTAADDADLFADLDLDDLPPPPAEPKLDDAPRASTGLTGLLRALDEEEEDGSWLKEVQTGSLDNIFEDGEMDFPDARKSRAEAEASTGLTDFLQELTDDQPETPPTSTGLTDLLQQLEDDEDEDPMAWARDTGDEDFVPASDTADPLAWARDAGIEFGDEDNDAVADFSDIEDEDVAVSSRDVDPLAWARSAGIEIEADDSAPLAEESAVDDEFVPPTDSLAWLGLDDDDESDAVLDAPQTPPPAPAKESTDWLADDTLLEEMIAFEDMASGSSSTGELLGAQDEPNWDEEDQAILAAIEEGDEDIERLLDQEAVAWLADDSPEELAENLTLEWEDELEEEETPSINLFGDIDDEGEPQQAPVDLFADVDDEGEPQQAPVDLFADVDDEGEPQQAPIDLFADVDDEGDAIIADEEDEDIFVPQEDPLAWARSAGIAFDDEEDTGEVKSAWTSEGQASMANIPDDWNEEDPESRFERDWMGEGRKEDDELPSWLNALEEETAEPNMPSVLNRLGDGDDQPAWLSQEDSAEAEAMPDWLSEALPDTLTEEEETEEDAFAWEEEAPSASEAWTAETEDAEDAADEIPDWLSAVSAMEDESEASVDDEQPSWLSASAEFDEDESEAQAEWLSEEDDLPEEDAFGEPKPQWLSDEDEEAAIAWDAETDDQPAWLSQAVSDADDEDEEAAIAWDAEADDQPAWLSQAVSDEGDDEEAYDEEAVYEEVADFGLDWGEGTALAEDASADGEDESLEWVYEEDMAETAEDDEEQVLPSAVTGMTGLLSNIRASRGEPEYLATGESPEAADDDDEAMLDWLQDIDAEEEEKPSTAVAPVPDWLAEAGVFDEETVEDEESSIPSWLNEEAFEEETPETTTSPEWAADDASDEETAMPDWLVAAEPIDETPLEEAEQPAWLTEAVYDDEQDADMLDMTEDIQEMRYAPEIEDDYAEEEIAPGHASNAPDWLNAMVPGLDIDYSAQEDAPIEREFAPEPMLSAQSADDDSDYAWVNQLVDEETALAATLPPMPPAPPELPPATPAPQRRRFVFSRPPAWLRRSAPKPSAETSASASWLDDFDDDE